MGDCVKMMTNEDRLGRVQRARRMDASECRCKDMAQCKRAKVQAAEVLKTNAECCWKLKMAAKELNAKQLGSASPDTQATASRVIQRHAHAHAVSACAGQEREPLLHARRG